MDGLKGQTLAPPKSLKFYDSPFHVAHDKEVADKMALEVDLEQQTDAKTKEENI
jgi:hypothetical protein